MNQLICDYCIYILCLIIGHKGFHLQFFRKFEVIISIPKFCVDMVYLIMFYYANMSANMKLNLFLTLIIH